MVRGLFIKFFTVKFYEKQFSEVLSVSEVQSVREVQSVSEVQSVREVP